ncbi:endonuclease VII domain-containing protein [Streptomyces sp. ISL-44]|nr:endonuclease VII domain-containing protein [Streptomyces sp. ISL-44]
MKHRTEYRSDRTAANGRYSYCNSCRSVQRQGESRGVKRHGLTLAEREALLANQGGVCAICEADTPGSDRSWPVDHDHSCCPRKQSCGRCVRGILCYSCNTALGHARDSVGILSAMITYLERAAA